MTKKVALILGNGFSIDFVNFMSDKCTRNEINLTNLFSDGDALRWPLDGRPGFLSYNHCPNLWSIGARSFLAPAETLKILERVVTCANVYSLKGNDNISDKTGNGFLHAYKELVTYLKYLFIHYNEAIPDIPDEIKEWPWAQFLLQLDSDQNIDEVVVVSYNYDIWLERILSKLGIDFQVPLLSTDAGKFRLFKPHGSISYQHSKALPKDSFSINYNSLFVDCPISDIVVTYDDLERHTPVNFIIPPAGVSVRSSDTWDKLIRTECISRINTLKAEDVVMLCGISYWHVDRAEVDALINSMHPEIDFVHIDPYPSPTLDAVLNSLFTHYTHLSTSKLLKGYPV